MDKVFPEPLERIPLDVESFEVGEETEPARDGEEAVVAKTEGVQARKLAELGRKSGAADRVGGQDAQRV